MLICGECGATNEDGEDFCGECGSYLDWDAQPVATETPAARAEPASPEPAPPEPEPAAPGFAERVKTAVGLGKADEAAPATEEAAAPAANEPAAAATANEPAAPAETRAAETASDDDRAASPAASLVVRKPPEKKPAAPGKQPPSAAAKTAAAKTAAQKPAAQKPGAQKPGAPSPAAVRPGAAAPKARRPAARVEEPPPAPGDLICGRCGTGNKPTRKFCRRCGADLVDAPVAQHPWWKRWFKGRVKKAPPTAGTRPAQSGRRVPTGLVVVAVVVAVLAAVAWLGRGLVSPAYQAVLDRVMGTDAVNPTRLTASSSAPGAGPERARDGLSNRFWAPARPGNGAGEWLQARFADPTRIVYVVVSPGVSTEEDAFLRKGRPKDVELRLVSADGTRKVESVTLDDEPGPQQFNVATNDVRAVRMTIKSSYPGTDQGSRVAVAELEFSGRS